MDDFTSRDYGIFGSDEYAGSFFGPADAGPEQTTDRLSPIEPTRMDLRAVELPELPDQERHLVLWTAAALSAAILVGVVAGWVGAGHPWAST